MAEPELSHRLKIELGDGADPEVFGFMCGANARTVRLVNNMGEEVMLDCSNPLDVMPAINRWTESQDSTFELSGRVAKAAFATWRGWADSGATKNIRVTFDEASANGGGYYTLPAILAQFEMTTTGNATVAFTASISAAGRRTWTNAS